MKKMLSVILAVLMLLSAVSVIAYAVEEEDPGYYEITFLDYDGSAISSFFAQRGAIVPAPANPTRENTEKYEYTFKGWSDDGGKTLYYQGTIPIATKDVTYTAFYAETEKVEVLTFWGFVKSIFERINMIFEYFANLFRQERPPETSQP